MIHRIIVIPARKNILFHYTLSAEDNLCTITTIKKDSGMLFLSVITHRSQVAHCDRVVDDILSDMEEGIIA